MHMWIIYLLLSVGGATSVSIAINRSMTLDSFQVSRCNCNFNIIASNHTVNTWGMNMTTSIPVQLISVRLLYLCICIYLMYLVSCLTDLKYC
jgi:hypothetical protein